MRQRTAETVSGPSTELVRTVGSARRRSLIALGMGVVLAGLLAAVLFTTVDKERSATSNDVVMVSGPSAQGVGAQTAQLLDLDVLSTSNARPAPNFTLVDQHGSPISLRQFRGKVVVWSLNDDKCTDLCRLYAQDVVAADRDLGRAAKDVVFLSVNANPYYPSTQAVRAWSVQNDLENLANWVYVTGSPAQLAATWKAYQVTVLLDPKSRTVVHDTTLDFIGPSGHIRAVGEFANGSIDTAYYAHGLAQMADDLLPANERVTVGGPNVNAPTTDGATIGDRAPAFDLSVLGSKATDTLTSFADKPLVLNFWSSTCSQCVQELPALQQVYAAYHHKIDFAGIDVADPRSPSVSLAFARRLGVRYPLLADPDGSTAAGYRVDALPVTFIVSPKGTIMARHPGALTVPELEAILEMDYPNLPPPST